MSCVRKDSIPIKMDNSGATSISIETQADSQKRRRRFHPLRNLRRIFRRRSIAHGDVIRPITQQQHQHYYHRNDLNPHHHYHNVRSSTANHQCTCTSIHCSCAIIDFQTIDDNMLLPNEIPDFQTSQYMRSPNHSNAMTENRRTYYGKAGMKGNMHIDCDSDRELADCQRSFSEGKLINSRDTLSHSHDSVFSESATPSTLSIVLKTELADALRKRNGRSDISEEDPETPHFPSIHARNASHIAIDRNIHGYRRDNHQGGSLDLLDMVTPEAYENSEDQSEKSMYDNEWKNGSSEIFPLEISHDSAIKLSHSAAKHKMAIRPKKKGPTRLSRKPNEELRTSDLFPTLKVNGEFINSLNDTSESLANKSQSLPRGSTTAQAMEKHSTLKSKLISNEKYIVSSRTIGNNYEYEKKHQATATTTTTTTTHSDNNRHASKTILLSADSTKHEINRTFDSSQQDDCAHSEEGFFRRFINRSGRKSKKEPRDELNVQNENSQMNRNAKRIENSMLPIKKGTELSILNVLSKARTNGSQMMQSLHSNDSSYEADSNARTTTTISKNDRSHAISTTQSFLSKETSQSSKMISHDTNDGSPQMQSDLMSVSSPVNIRQEKSTSYLRFSPPSSKVKHYDSDQHHSASSPLEKFIRQSHYWSAETLNTKNVRGSSTLGAGTSEYFWPKDNNNRFTQHSNKNGSGWSQCQQKISKISNDHHRSSQTKLPAKAKMVEKSKSFRLYTKNFDISGDEGTHEEFKPTLCTTMPSLPNLNSTNNLSKCDLNGLRCSSNSNGNGNSNCTVNKNAIDHWAPMRSNSSSRLSDVCSNKFEINDMNLLPTSNFYSTLSPSNETTSLNSSVIDSGDSKARIFIGSKGPSFSSQQSNQNPNIYEIEDNIDKIMKSSMVTVLKKSSTSDLSQTKANKNSLATDNERDALNTVKIENPPLLRHSTTTSTLDFPIVSPLSSRKTSAHVPEFMRIQLNRIVDVSRPKSCIEYSSSSLKRTPNGTNDDDKERRFSNESIEISDRNKTGINAPIMNTFNTNLTKSSESLKSGFSLQSHTYSGNQQLSRGSSTSEMNRTLNKNDIQSSITCLNYDSDTECDSNVVIERRKSVSDKKLKFEKQIEKIQAEMKRSSTIGLDKNVTNIKHQSIEDDGAMVVLRIKQTSSKANDDSTPELMKVFARRSLKIKDTDLDNASTNANRTACDTNNNVTDKLKNRFNADSDKENTTNDVDESKSIESPNESNDFDVDARVKPDNKEPKSVRSIGKLFNGSSNSYFPTNISNSVANNNYRNSTTLFENIHEKKTKRSNLIIDKNKSFNIMDVSIDDENHKFNKNTMASIPTNTTGITKQTIHSNLTDDNENTVQKSNGNTISKSPELNDLDIEYKGIHERKAEWEKRATQAFK